MAKNEQLLPKELKAPKPLPFVKTPAMPNGATAAIDVTKKLAVLAVAAAAMELLPR